MPTCRKCGSEFPNWLKINGVMKNLGGRKYCLTCSPWGKHNTRKLDLPTKDTKICPICGEKRSLEEFYRLSNGKIYTYCKRCDRKRAEARQTAFKLEAVSYKGGKCVVCGYDRYRGALEFHHLDPAQKDFELNNLMKFTDEIRKELDKCALVCANCHAEIHGGIVEIKRQ